MTTTSIPGVTPVLDVSHLSKTYGTGDKAVHAVGDLVFSVTSGELACIVGPSGAGKTTLLKCIAGLLEPSGGTIRFRGEPVTEPPAEMALVFQEYSRSLMPWRTVHGNVALPLAGKVRDRAERERLVRESLEIVGLEKFADHHPWQLSGGMQQRVAIARALAYQPKMLVMDEPFASVDAQVRAELEDLLLRLVRETGITTLVVTHDIDEAVYLSDRVIVLSKSPTRVIENIDIDLPRERDQLSTKALPEYVELRARVAGLIKNAAHGVEKEARADA